MNFLGVGPGELLLIFILLLVVVGPERLPGLARSFGRGLVRVRNWMQTSPDAALVLRARQELEAELAEIRSSLLEVQTVREEMLGVAKQLDEVVSPIGNTRANLADLLKEPADKPLPRTSNGQADLPQANADAAASLDEQPVSPEQVGTLAPTETPATAATLDVPLEETVSGAPPSHAAAQPPPPRDIEELGRRIEELMEDWRAFQEQSRAEAALKSAQIESLMADMHALQQQLKDRELLSVDWQPPSWAMSLPGERDLHIQEAEE